MLIAINLKLNSTYDRGVFKGILSYASLHPDVKLRVPGSEMLGHDQDFEPQAIIGTHSSYLEKSSPPEVPIVNTSSKPYGDSYQVCTDNLELSKMALDHFRKWNLHNFVFIHHIGYRVSDVRWQSFSQRCHDSGFHLHTLNISNRAKWNEKDLEALGLLPKPGAVLIPDDSFAPPLLQACRELGIRIPQDLAILGVNNDRKICPSCQPGLSSIEIDDEMIGFEALKTAHRLLKGKSAPKVQLIPPKQLVARDSTMNNPGRSQNIVKALAFMHSKFREPLNMCDLVAQQSLGRRALEKDFQKETGEAPMAYLRSLRMNNAKFLLKTTDLNVSEVGRECGIPDGNYLSRLFRIHLKVTPLEYRKGLTPAPDSGE